MFDARFQKFIQGKGYSYFERNLGVAVGGDALKWMIRNPKNSGKTIYLIRILFRNTTATRVQVETIDRPAVADFATVINTAVPGAITPRRVPQAASIAILSRVDTGNDFTTSGIWYDDLLAATSKEVVLGIVLPPDSDVVFGIKVPGGGDTPIAVPEWYEE